MQQFQVSEQYKTFFFGHFSICHQILVCVINSHFVVKPRETGRNKYRPSQTSPIPNFTLGGDWTSQKFLGSMEGAVLGGKLAAEVVANRAKGNPDKPIKEIQQNIIDAAASHVAKEPAGVKGDGAIAWGAGASFSKDNTDLLKESDPAQFATA